MPVARRHSRFLIALAALASLVACAAASIGQGGPGPSAARLRLWAFTAPWDARSDASALAHARDLDAVISGWIQLDSVTGAPFAEFRDTLAHLPNGVRRMALVTNASGGRFHVEPVRALAANAVALARVAGDVARRAAGGGYRGLVIDVEGLAPADLAANVALTRALADSARAHGLSPIAIAIPASDSVGYPAHAFFPAVDYVIVMLYDEHWATSPPGAIASPDWVRRALAARIADVGARRVVAALPLYGYRWPPSGPATPVSFDEARRNAAEAGTSLSRDEATQTLRAQRPGAWELWVSDATQLDALLRETASAGVTTVALWRLGLEDPAVWGRLRAR